MRDKGAVFVDRSQDQIRLYSNALNSTSTDWVGGTDLPTNTTQLLVGRVTFHASGDEVFTLVANPTSTNEATAFSTGQTVVSRDISMTAFDQWGVLANAANNGTHLYDEIRIANTYAEVLAIPEPSAVALLVLGAGLVAVGHRSRA